MENALGLGLCLWSFAVTTVTADGWPGMPSCQAEGAPEVGDCTPTLEESGASVPVGPLPACIWQARPVSCATLQYRAALAMSLVFHSGWTLSSALLGLDVWAVRLWGQCGEETMRCIPVASIAKCKVVITFNQGLRGGRVFELKKIVDEAVKSCPTIQHVLVAHRTENKVPMGELDVHLEQVGLSHFLGLEEEGSYQVNWALLVVAIILGSQKLPRVP